MHITIVSPVYMAEGIVDELIKRVIDSLSKITNDFEIILVDDGSSDNSWIKIQENCKKDKRIKGIKLSRNFGQHYALTAGLEKSLGDYVVVMDCDLQVNPEYILEMHKEALKGNDIVYTSVSKRSHSFKKYLFKNVWCNL